MAAKLKESLGVDPELIPKGGGIFDVVVDGKLIYSKFETGSFPDEAKLVADLASKHGSA